MELYQLRTFVAVAEEAHLTRAAERLHLSQPAVSGQIKALEQEFDLRLFERSSTGMALTAAGRTLLLHAQRALAAADELKRAARQLKGEVSGTVRIGTVSDPESTRVGELLGLAVQRYPRLELELQHGVTGAALEAVRDGRLDATYFFGDAPGAEFVALPLREFVYRVTAPGAWSEQVAAADWAEIASMPWILTPEISTHRRLITTLFAEHGIELPQKRIEADQEPVLVSLVTAGVGVSLVREDIALARQRAGEVCVWDRARLLTTLWFVCAADRAADPLLRVLTELVRGLWQPAAAPRKLAKNRPDARSEAAV